MEKKLRTIDYELEQTEKRLEDLLAGIKQLRKEVHDMLPPQVKKVVHERVVLYSKKKLLMEKIDLRDYLRGFNPDDIHILNIVRCEMMRFEKYNFYNTPIVYLSSLTKRKEVIITYIPENKLVIVVER